MSETGSIPEKRPDRIVIPLTPGGRKNYYIKLGEYTSFFPADSIGGPNKQFQAPKLLTLHFQGFSEPVKTDIDGAGNHFRDRGRIVRKFFDRYGLQENDKIVIVKRSEYEYDVVRDDAAAASGPPVEPGEGGTGHRRGFLHPFKPGADTDYITHVLGGSYRRGRTHETLVNDFADWLAARGLTVTSNAAIDLGLEQPPVIIEAKVIRAARWAQAIREAVGQLYEYRYFQVVAPESSLLFLASAEIPRMWLDYLDKDRKIGAAWRTTGGSNSPTARSQRSVWVTQKCQQGRTTANCQLGNERTGWPLSAHSQVGGPVGLSVSIREAWSLTDRSGTRSCLARHLSLRQVLDGPRSAALQTSGDNAVTCVNIPAKRHFGTHWT